MINLTSEMAQLWAALGSPTPGLGRAVQFVAASRGEGTSTVAREFARFAAGRASRPVWLIDLDLLGGGQYEAILGDPTRFGPLGRPAAATPDGSMFFTVQPPARDKDGRVMPDGAYLSAQQAGGSRLWVTRFRAEMLRSGQAPQLTPEADYWKAMRRHADWIVVDAPAAERSSAAVAIAPLVDCTVLVVAAEGRDTRAPAALRDAIEQAGGRCAGIVFNRARIAPPRFLKAILP
jgi:Mrp family chromosome partitioning ATPase